MNDKIRLINPFKLSKVNRSELIELKLTNQGGDSQNFLDKIVRFFVDLGLNILRLFRL